MLLLKLTSCAADAIKRHTHDHSVLVVGRNGAGKSSFWNICARSLAVDALRPAILHYEEASAGAAEKHVTRALSKFRVATQSNASIVVRDMPGVQNTSSSFLWKTLGYTDQATLLSLAIDGRLREHVYYLNEDGGVIDNAFPKAVGVDDVYDRECLKERPDALIYVVNPTKMKTQASAARERLVFDHCLQLIKNGRPDVQLFVVVTNVDSVFKNVVHSVEMGAQVAADGEYYKASRSLVPNLAEFLDYVFQQRTTQSRLHFIGWTCAPKSDKAVSLDIAAAMSLCCFNRIVSVTCAHV